MKTTNTTVHEGDNVELIDKAFALHIPDNATVLDVTYGRGSFWAGGQFERAYGENIVKHDLSLDGVDFRRLPEADESVDVVVFDPPYIPQGGRTTSTCQDFLNRYGLTDVPETMMRLQLLIAHGMCEAVRVLKGPSKGYGGGLLFVKCKDYVNSGKWRAGHHHVLNVADVLGLEQLDEWVHYAGTGPQPTTNPDGTPRRQLHARSAHSFLCVFGKVKR